MLDSKVSSCCKSEMFSEFSKRDFDNPELRLNGCSCLNPNCSNYLQPCQLVDKPAEPQITSMEQFDQQMFPEYCKEYPILMHVTEQEQDAILRARGLTWKKE